jgi:hypothetical protein
MYRILLTLNVESRETCSCSTLKTKDVPHRRTVMYAKLHLHTSLLLLIHDRQKSLKPYHSKGFLKVFDEVYKDLHWTGLPSLINMRLAHVVIMAINLSIKWNWLKEQTDTLHKLLAVAQGITKEVREFHIFNTKKIETELHYHTHLQ